MVKSKDELYDRVDYLRKINQQGMVDRSRIRDILNGGEEAGRA